MGARAPPTFLCFHTMGAEQEVGTPTPELDETPSLEPIGSAGLNVGPTDHLRQGHRMCLLKRMFLGWASNSGNQAFYDAIATFFYTHWSLRTFETLMGERDELTKDHPME